MGLRILTPPTCVGLRYGRVQSRARSFSWHLGSPTLAAIAFVLRFSLTSDGFAYLTAYTRIQPDPSPVPATLMRPSTLKRLLAVPEF